MRLLLYICSNSKRCDAISTVIKAQSGYYIFTAETAFEAIDVIKNRPVDTILVDLEQPVSKLDSLLQIAEANFPHIYRIFIRGKHFSIKQHSILSTGHGSFFIPSCKVELEGMMYKLERNFPVVTDKKEKPKKINMRERLIKFLVTFSNSDKLLIDFVEQIENDVELSKLLLNRVNSPHYALQSRIENVERAVSLLGIQGVISLFEETIQCSSKDAAVKVA